MALGAALYEKEPGAKELAAFGLTPEDVAGPPVEVWPEHKQAFELFEVMGSQWRVGMGGATGLDYGPLFHKLDRLDLTAERYDELEEQIRVMERAALVEMSKH